MLRILSLTATLILLIGAWIPVHATDYLTVGAGYFNVLDQDHTDAAGSFMVEYRGEYVWGGLRPAIGFSTTSHGSAYGYAGGYYDWNFYDRLYVSPNFMAGAYAQGGGADLGHAIEFRSGLELGYEFEDTQRVSVAFNHTSNASLGDKNPGVEILTFNYSIPLGGIFR